jgi:Zinc knuckle
MTPQRCETCGAWGHRAKACPLKRLNEMQETLGPRKPLANPAKTVTCPTCGALAGFRCVDHTGQIVVVCEQNSHRFVLAVQKPSSRSYLACGHMITGHPEDLKESSSPSMIECWACEEESKGASKKRFPPTK